MESERRGRDGANLAGVAFGWTAGLCAVWYLAWSIAGETAARAARETAEEVAQRALETARGEFREALALARLEDREGERAAVRIWTGAGKSLEQGGGPDAGWRPVGEVEFGLAPSGRVLWRLKKQATTEDTEDTEGQVE